MFDTCAVSFLCALLCVSNVCALNRTHYLAILEEEWDYAPEGNLISDDHSYSDIFTKTQTNPPQIGSKYIKALLREYTDETYTTRVPRPKYMGIVGPILRGEVGDIVKVNLWNRAKYNYSLHPHGPFYDKDDEGAQYLDGTTGEDILDNAIPPNGKYEYEWTIKPEYGPEPSDPDCNTYLYHTHAQSPEVEMMSGVIGLLLICKEGTLDEEGNRNDVDKEFPLLVMGWDENFSYYLGQNMQRYIPNATVDDVVANYKNYQLSNQKYSLNGLSYGNLKGLEACVGDKVSFSIATVGNDLDLHTVWLQGQTMEVYRHRVFTLPMYPGESRTALVTVEQPGTWYLASQSALDIAYGMQTLFTAKVCEGKEIPAPQKLKKGKKRYHYIATEEVWWNYTPTGRDELSGKKLRNVNNAKNSYISDGRNCPLEGIFKKVIFRGYKDERFRDRLEHPKYLGFMGPPIKAEIGDTVVVVFKNKAKRSYSMYAYGFFIQETEEGREYRGPSKVAPGETQVYKWTVPESAGPTETDSECLTGRYFSAVDPVHDTYAGLTGPLVICKKGVLNKDGVNKRVDEEFFLTFGWMDETLSPYINETIKRKCPEMNLDLLYSNSNFTSQTKVGAINGYAWGNIQSPTMCKGERVNWYVSAIGTEQNDVHGPYFHGNTFIARGNRKDSVVLIPDSFDTLFMIPENEGIWAIDDQTDDAYANGMRLRYVVKNCRRGKEDKKDECRKHERSSEDSDGSGSDNSERDKSRDQTNERKPRRKKPTKCSSRPKNRENVRTYYIAAVEDIWDYAPFSEIHPVTGELLTEERISRIAYRKDDYHIGQKYIKAMYREFTDETFSEQKKRTFSENHLGLLGPMIKAEVGEKLRVVFKNMANFSYSIMPHGVMYDKENEGTIYVDGVPSRLKAGGLVPPGQTYTYEWTVPKSAGPSKDDFNCITWMYLSGVDPNIDVYSGLAGPLIICRKGILTRDGRRKDVQREYALFFEIYVEVLSNYIDANIATLKAKDEVMKMKDDPKWFETNVMMTVNGFGYANIPDVTMYLGDKTAFYLISYGNEFQTHTVHFHGNTFLRTLSGGQHRHDVMDVLPGDFDTVEMLAVNPGKWLVHCHINNHSENGMLMEYEVIDPAVQPHAIPNE